MKSSKSSLALVALCLLFGVTLNPNLSLAQSGMSPEDEAIYKNMVKGMGMDPNVMMQAQKQVKQNESWTDSKDGIIHYHIVGEFKGQTNVSSDSNWGAFADITDRVTIDMDWKLSEAELVGTPTFENSKSVVTNPHNPEPKCAPPEIQGLYEHLDLQEVKPGLSGALELQVKTDYPAVSVAQFCTGARKAIPAATKMHPMEFNVLSPVMLTMQLPPTDNMLISPDKKSLIHKDGGWTWTFTPSARH